MHRTTHPPLAWAPTRLRRSWCRTPDCVGIIPVCLRTIVLIILISAGSSTQVFPGQHFQQRPALCPALHSFMDAVFKTAISEKDRKARLQDYESAIQQVMRTARKHFGPFWDPRVFHNAVIQYVRHQEMYRRPPEGWDPRGSRDNIVLFSDIARGGLRIDLDLLSWCEEHNLRGHRPRASESHS